MAVAAADVENGGDQRRLTHQAALDRAQDGSMGWHLRQMAGQKVGAPCACGGHLTGAVLASAVTVSNRPNMRHLVTGGAGFIGANYVHRLLERGEEAIVYDDVSRPGVSANVDWLRATHGERAFS